MKKFTFRLFSLASIAFMLIFTASCGSKKKATPPPPKIPVVAVLQHNVPIYKEFVGQVYGEMDIPIRARVSGFLEGIYFQEGRRVKKGQLLYKIDPQPYQAKVAQEMSKLAEAKTSFVKAQSDLERIEPLAKMNAVSKSDLDAAKAQYDAAKAYVEAAQASVRLAKIQLGYCSIYSPINGIIGKTNAKVGEFVGQNPNPVILNTVSKIKQVSVDFYLPESDYLSLARSYRADSAKMEKVRKRGETKGSLQLILSDGSTYKYPGKVDFINRQVDPTTGTILIQATFPNPDKVLRPGLFARVKARIYVDTNALLIPQRCIQETQGKSSVFVVQDSVIRFVSVETGPTVGDMWIIKKGLKNGDHVVLEGLQYVKDGMKVIPELKTFQSQSKVVKQLLNNQ
ncbi:efflux RND transporter periplasmic adaptor subunit [Candidatus Sulfidibacterium hydrothermale]|uniref:efflux RND transporter periplasmic adaptor subunit n=1 Tax=Candidatus Sulfidibacterium hydrothermale TaxID=2875962 RepID=UPI001F0AC280|nr:efflux RND transporter periplasmic adaptor subunit [Candidatus Sulfidibacterium hydrothermale]UBM62743.1 efflux RND transporter periplasmic adaptor subunit [Candidatus Sulfidibacterium hydrothermale]